VHRHAAGIDIGATFHVVAVPADADEEPVRRFNSFTGDLHQLADWLTRVGITTVAMESTGIYWIPVYEILEARGLEVVLVNARDAKTVPGRKTDVNDAQWIQRLHEHGLLRASFRPHESIVALRTYLRHRERMVEFSASHIQHMQKALMQMNLQLHHVVSDITGATGMKIIRAILAGILPFVYAGGRSRPHTDSWAGSVLGASPRCRVWYGQDAVADGQALHIVAGSFRSGRLGQNVRSA
jgi:transposase